MAGLQTCSSFHGITCARTLAVCALTDFLFSPSYLYCQSADSLTRCCMYSVIFHKSDNSHPISLLTMTCNTRAQMVPKAATCLQTVTEHLKQAHIFERLAGLLASLSAKNSVAACSFAAASRALHS